MENKKWVSRWMKQIHHWTRSLQIAPIKVHPHPRWKAKDIQFTNKENSSIFPEVPVRQSYKIFNPDILEELSGLESVYRIPARVSRQVLVDIANNIFGPNWILLPDEKDEG